MEGARPPFTSEAFNRQLPLEPGSAFQRDRPLPAAELGFPSPANENFLSDPEDALRRQPVTARLCDTPMEHGVPGPLPQPPVSSFFPLASPTPSLEPRHELGMNAIVGGTLPPTDVSLPTPPIAKAGRNLRLPSFQLLGIANPHPDRITANPEQMVPFCGGGPLSQPEDPLHMRDSSLSGPNPGVLPDRPEDFSSIDPSHFLPNHKPVQTFITTFTPPDESGTLNWNTLAHVRTQAVESPASGPDRPGPSRTTSASDTRDTGAPSQQPNLPVSSTTPQPWLTNALKVLGSDIDSVGETSIRILSHALPSPSTAGHAFPAIINAVHARIPPRSTTWINVFHAVPGRFNLADLPTSPPSTPGPAIGGEDYFTSMIFDSAVPIADYQGDARPLPPSPRPVVPPATINFAIVERYIPPTNAKEFLEMYSTTGRSPLGDRLVELTPNDGTLIFIYPTKAGARTFLHDILGPILEPMLRSLVIINGLSADLGATLGPMPSVEQLPEFDEAKAQLEAYCHRLSRPDSTLQAFHGRNARYSVVYAAKEEVVLERKVWAEDWWIKQEKPRVRAAVAKYFRLANRLPVDAEVMPVELIQKILDGVATRPYPAGMEPRRGVEVGVFVIKKSRVR